MQSIDVINSELQTSIIADAFSLEDVESEGGHSYGDEDYFIARFNVKLDGADRALANVLIVGFPNAGGELTMLTITRPTILPHDDICSRKVSPSVHRSSKRKHLNPTIFREA